LLSYFFPAISCLTLVLTSSGNFADISGESGMHDSHDLSSAVIPSTWWSARFWRICRKDWLQSLVDFS
jgi:hypothetical protein